MIKPVGCLTQIDACKPDVEQSLEIPVSPVPIVNRFVSAWGRKSDGGYLGVRLQSCVVRQRISVVQLPSPVKRGAHNKRCKAWRSMYVPVVAGRQAQLVGSKPRTTHLVYPREGIFHRGRACEWPSCSLLYTARSVKGFTR